ncbi:reductive dehalogenase domain-containing protein [Dehalogenimonas sp. THU2]|uniref:twin-arginine translocation signal domain-containing protein n=1 Tax=Dehalogenimonas sp. THU2 TaxID=3151121 RepID=UPI0032183765
MKGFHTTVNRRDFMKGLGLAGAGIGAASLVAPQFQDMDDVLSSPKSNFKHAWFVKNRDAFNPTVEIDWDQIKPWKLDAEWGNFQKIQNADVLPGFLDNQKNLQALKAQWRTEQRERYDIKFDALSGSANFWSSSATAGSPAATGFTDVAADTRWRGTPEEAARIVRAAFSYLGMPEVHFLSATDQRIINLGSQGTLTDTQVDAKVKSLIVAVQRKDITIGRNSTGDPYGYSHRNLLLRRQTEFITRLGYNCVGEVSGPNAAYGALGGGSEMSRLDHSVSPRFGAGIKVWTMLATDLELPEDTPIDAGIFRFCANCMTCADMCRLNGNFCLSEEREPSWESHNTLPPAAVAAGVSTWDYKRPGVKRYFADYAYCDRGNCLQHCWGQCVFNELTDAGIHSFLKPVIATLGGGPGQVFDKAIMAVEGVMPFGVRTFEEQFESIERWWNRDLSKWHYDEQTGAGSSTLY